MDGAVVVTIRFIRNDLQNNLRICTKFLPCRHIGWWDPHTAMASDPSIREDPLPIQEVERVVSELKGDQAAGVYRVPFELLKMGVDSMNWCLHAPIEQLWPTCIVPTDGGEV